jgi:hypothetical protein
MTLLSVYILTGLVLVTLLIVGHFIAKVIEDRDASIMIIPVGVIVFLVWIIPTHLPTGGEEFKSLNVISVTRTPTRVVVELEDVKKIQVYNSHSDYVEMNEDYPFCLKTKKNVYGGVYSKVILSGGDCPKAENE